jgi:broad specificity phosphatase PhoE
MRPFFDENPDFSMNYSCMIRSLLLLFTAVLLTQCRSTKVYIVRHAEKSTQPAGDPDLTALGRARAEALADLLRGEDIRQIYSTETRRTRQTAEPLSLQTGVPVRAYANDTLLKFLYRVLDEEKNTVIVGHSNTVLKMLDEWSLRHSTREIPDNDYDNLFVVSAKPRNGPGGYKLRLKERTYGKKSPDRADSTRSTMKMP